VEEWHDFFVVVAGAAAVLAGLVFVGVSINLDTIMSNPGYGLPGRALEALVLLVAVLIATILLLVPAFGASPGNGASRSRSAGSRARRLGDGRDHPGACAEELAVAGALLPMALRAACGAVPGGYATDRGRGGGSDGLGCGWTLLACGRCGSLVLGCGARRVGPTRRDPPLR
jgi:hypothetical protein